MTPQTFNNGSRGANGNMSKMIILSLIVHLIVISTAIVAIPTTSRHLTFGQAYSVQLVGPEVMIPSKDSAALSDILRPTETASPIIIKKEVSGLSSTPVKKEDVSRLEIEKALSALKQKETRAPQTASTIAASTNTKANMSPAQAGSRLDEYVGFINTRIKHNWTLPQALRPVDNIETIIEVRILSNGAVERLNFEKRSGNRYVDDSAMKAVQKSMPFPPFPEGMTDHYIEIGIRFHPSELR
jgi:TonB family protein